MEMWKTPIYKTMRGMYTRCNAKPGTQDYENYALKGITICDEWKGRENYSKFFEWAEQNGYKEGLQIDRIDNTKGYSPQNCRFVTRDENNRNKRDSVRWYLGDKEFESAKLLGDSIGVHHHTVRERVQSPNYPEYTTKRLYPDEDIRVRPQLYAWIWNCMSFPSASSMAKSLGTTRHIARARVDSDKYPNYIRVPR